MNKIKKLPLHKHAEEATYESGSYFLEQRGMPDFRDGLKPVHRRILWSLYKLKAFSNSKFVKHARLSGDVSGKFHPHGSASVEGATETLVKSPHPTVEGYGEWGDYEDKAAQARYVECRLSKYAETKLLDPVYLQCVPMVDTYDGTYKEPVYLPAKLPNLLLNGTEGIATGASNLIPSFSVDSIIEIVKLGLKKKITPKMCYKILEFKFTYGGLDYNDEEDLLEYFKTGFSRLYFLPEYEHDEGSSKLTITGLSPRFNIGKTLGNLAEIQGVKGIEDLREGETIKFVITLQKSNQDDVIEEIDETLTTTLNAQTYVTTRHDDGITVDFEKTTIPKILNDWILYRIDLEKRVLKVLTTIERDKLAKQELLLLAVINRKIIIQALDNKNPDSFLKKKLKITIDQANQILDLKVRRLAKLEQAPIKVKIKEHKLEIKTLNKDKKDVKARILRSL